MKKDSRKFLLKRAAGFCFFLPKKWDVKKIEKWWKGPYQVVQRVGRASFQVRTDRSVLSDVHYDHLKPCHLDMDLEESYPLVFRSAEPSEQRPPAIVVDRVL